jgi:hypothetical protein
MPPQIQLAKDQPAAIVQYVRELQVANGIIYRPKRRERPAPTAIAVSETHCGRP